MRKLDVHGDPIVILETETHVLCVRDFPSEPSKPEYIVWRKDIDGSVSSGSYFPTLGKQLNAFAEALVCFDDRAKTDLTYRRELGEVQAKLDQLGREFVELERQYQDETARLKGVIEETLNQQNRTINSLMAKLRR